jgi:hypothetical protein
VTLWETLPDPGPIRLEDYEAWKAELGAPSKGLMQIIPESYRPEYDPLANMMAAVEYAQEIVTAPRRGGKVTAIEKAMAIAREAGMVSGEGFARGGVIPSPTGRLDGVSVRLSPGEFVLTPDAASEIFARRMEAAMVELNDVDRVPEPPDDYPEPPTVAPF